MHLRRRRRVGGGAIRLPAPPTVLATLALFVALGGSLAWAHGGVPGAVHTCVDDSSGGWRVTADPTRRSSTSVGCAKSEHALDIPATEIYQSAEPPGAYSKLSKGKNAVVATLSVPSPGTYVATARVAVSALQAFDAGCQLLTGPSDYSRGSDVAEVAYPPIQGTAGELRKAVISLMAVMRYPASRESATRTIIVRCYHTPGSDAGTYEMTVTRAKLLAWSVYEPRK